MIKIDGSNLIKALEILKVNDQEKKESETNADRILRFVVNAFEKNYGSNIVGKNGQGIISKNNQQKISPTGLVYGRIQSGKTRAMTITTALSYDNGFRIAIVITTNITDLVEQTQNRFTSALPGNISVYKESDFKRSIEQAKLILNSSSDGIAIVCSINLTPLSRPIFN